MPQQLTADSHRVVEQLLARDANGVRQCIPVFGTGINIQAAHVAGYPHRDDWRQLLTRIGEQVLPKGTSIDSLPRAPLSLWETLVCRWARAKNVFPFEAENALQVLIGDELRRQEEECRAFELYRVVAQCGFADILSLNFDRRIALGVPKSTWVTGPTPCPLGSHGETLFRHSFVSAGSAPPTRVWYPHGDVKKTATIKFGVRKYGFHLGVLREYLGGVDAAWRYRLTSQTVLPDARVKELAIREAPSWLPAALTRPLLFIGCGLSLQEWALWWLLRRRMESGAAPALFLTIGDATPPHLRGRREVHVVRFDSPERLWSSFLQWIS